MQARTPKRLPVVLTQREVRDLLAELNGPIWLMVSLLYGTGMRLLECLRLRVKDIDFERREIIVRESKGIKGRVAVLPGILIGPLRDHLARVRQVHKKDIEAGFGDVHLPSAQAVKYPKAGRAWDWQYVFRPPGAALIRDPASNGATTCFRIRCSARCEKRRDA